MATTTKQINQYTAAVTIDPVVDYLLIDPAGTGAYLKINRNTIMGVSGTPADISTAQTFTNKVIGNTNTITGKDGSTTLQNTSDTTKQAKFSLASITTGNTRTYTLPDISDTLATLTATQTLTNKTLTSPTINSPTITNASITADTVSGYTTSNTGNIYGIAVTTGQITGSSTVAPAALATGVSYAKFSNPYKFSVYRNSAQNTGNGSLSIINFDTKIYDTGSNVDIVTNVGRFTAPVSGWYRFEAAFNATTTSTNQDVFIALYKNGSEVRRGPQIRCPTTTTAFGTIVAAELQLSANDYIEVYSLGSAALALGVGSAVTAAYFMGSLISIT